MPTPPWNAKAQPSLNGTSASYGLASAKADVPLPAAQGSSKNRVVSQPPVRAVCRLIVAPRNPRTFVGRDGEPRHAAIDAALKFLSGNYHRVTSLEEVARVAGMSAYHFQRTFRAWTGVTLAGC
jgi:hypothetical protein